MSLLAGVHYDPSTAATFATSALKAMTVLDATNLTVSFTAPSDGMVVVRERVVHTGATTYPIILLGLMNHSGGAVVARQAPLGGVNGSAVSSTQVQHEALFSLTGLSGAYSWDMAAAVQVLLASTNLRWGGPNDTTTNNAWGGADLEVYSAHSLLGSKLYDPGTAASKATTSLLAMTALDTTNLRITFTAPASGSVLVRMRGVVHGATTFPQILFGVLDGSTVRARCSPIGAIPATALATTQLALEGQCIVTGLTPGNSYTWDAAYGVEVVVSSTGLKYGGPNDASGNDAFGGFLYEIWAI